MREEGVRGGGCEEDVRGGGCEGRRVYLRIRVI